MSSEIEHFSHVEHPLSLKEQNLITKDAECYLCEKTVLGSAYACTSDAAIDCQNFYLHKSCAKLPLVINHQTHYPHMLTLSPRPHCFCDVCGSSVKFAYSCEICEFDVCLSCVLDSKELHHEGPEGQRPTLKHFSHPKHRLVLNEFAVVDEDDLCYVCDKAVIGCPTYTCVIDDDHCENFYLHKTCAELPQLINNHMHIEHPLSLLRRLDYSFCDVCCCPAKSAYSCMKCWFDVCISCTYGQKVLSHEGHPEHELVLQREAFFKCDACSEEAKDHSYVCTACDFWIHMECALLPLEIPDPHYHHHPLFLVYSIPEMHRYFSRLCAICERLVQRDHWLYYCHKCTYFVHMRCAHSVPAVEIEEIDINDEPDLVQFLLLGEESLLDVIVAQCGKFQDDFQGEGENILAVSDPHIIEQHWSHSEHPLQQLQITIRDNNDDDDDDDNDQGKMLICDGCIQPITISRPSYYACIKCGFFLHSFCATKLPQVLPPGGSWFHSHHQLLLRKMDSLYSFVKCGACSCDTNGFYFECSTCDVNIDIRCAFLPTRIKHESHKQHALVQHPLANSICKVSKLRITGNLGYKCETCSGFQIDIFCAFYPRRMKHKFDVNDLTLRQPPFFYEGVFYCEICEEQVNNQWWLYHCDESDHSFHHKCVLWYESIKLGGTIKVSIDNKPHTLALVLKRTTRKNSPRFVCRGCDKGYKCAFFFECNGCGLLLCLNCAAFLASNAFII